MQRQSPNNSQQQTNAQPVSEQWLLWKDSFPKSLLLSMMLYSMGRQLLMSFPSLVKKIHIYKCIYSQCWCFTKRFYGIANFKAGSNPQPPCIFPCALSGG